MGRQREEAKCQYIIDGLRPSQEAQKSTNRQPEGAISGDGFSPIVQRKVGIMRKSRYRSKVGVCVIIGKQTAVTGIDENVGRKPGGGEKTRQSRSGRPRPIKKP